MQLKFCIFLFFCLRIDIIAISCGMCYDLNEEKLVFFPFIPFYNHLCATKLQQTVSLVDITNICFGSVGLAQTPPDQSNTADDIKDWCLPRWVSHTAVIIISLFQIHWKTSCRFLPLITLSALDQLVHTSPALIRFVCCVYHLHVLITTCTNIQPAVCACVRPSVLRSPLRLKLQVHKLKET